MTFTVREQFITLLLIMHYSSIGKKLPSSVKLAILEYARDKKFPEITNEDWKVIQTDVEKAKSDMRTLLMQGFMQNPLKTKDDPNLLKLDSAVRENLDKIDIDEITKDVDMGSELSENNSWLRKLKNLKKDYDEKR